MILPGPIKKLLAVFRGSVSPVLIFLSILTGFWFGMVPGFSGFHVLLIVVILILNVHVGLFILSAVFGKALLLAAAPVIYHVGVWLQGNLTGLYSFLSSVPVIGLTDFSTYAVAGGFVIGPIVGAIIGLLIAHSVVSFRRMMLKMDEKSEAFRKWYSKTWVRILDRLLIGKRAKDVKSMFAKTKYIRKAGAALAIIVVAGTLVAAHFLKDTRIKNYAEEKMTNINGAEVDIDSLDLSLLKGSVSVGGVQVTDPENLANNQVSIGQIAADASVYDLFLGKVTMEKVEVSDIQFGQKRDTPGKPAEREVKKEPETFDPNKYKLGPEDFARFEKYFKDAKAIKEKLQTVRQYLPSGKGKEAGETEPQPEQVPQKYLEYLAAKASTPVSPRFIAEQAILDKVKLPSELFGNSNIKLSNLSDAPEAAGLPVTIDMKSLETPASMNITIDYSKEVPELSGKFDSLDLSKIQSSMSSESGIVFKSGLASGTFSGTVTKQAIDLTLRSNITNLNAEGQGGGVLGLGRDVTTESLSVLHNLKTTIRIVGPVTEPRLAFDVEGLTEQFKQALTKAGKTKALNEFNKRVGGRINDQIEENLPGGIKEAIPDANGVLKGLGGLLRR
jgi:uncharacterized protein (TIGR03546 family)